MSKGKEERNIRDYLNDILEMIEDVWNFTNNMSYEDLESDKKTLYAVIRCLEVLGEAVKKIPKDIREEYPEISWQEIAGIRDKLIHEYFGVDIEIVWDTIHEDLYPLKAAIIKIINDLY
ncbi:DUF86 domain-containing protein [bacterium]|nr:MAG: DUF86 domain-containing protein [bacterium]